MTHKETQEEAMTSLEQSFLIEQYKALREEISEIKKRVFRLITGTTVALPLVSLISSENSQLIGVSLVAPVVVFVLGLNYLSEKSSLMRAGKFIKDHIEPRIKNIHGWEAWLEDEGFRERNRRVEKRENLTFRLMFGIYYVLALVFAAWQVRDFLKDSSYLSNFIDVIPALLLILYGIIGVKFIKYLQQNPEDSTG